MKILLVAVGVALVCAGSVSAGRTGHAGPQPLGSNWGGSFGGSGSGFVEQQSNFPFDSAAVTNPTGCFWDINDYGAEGTSGYLTDSFSAPFCLVSDPDPIYRTLNGLSAWWSSPHLYFGSVVQSASPSLLVTVCYQPQARCFTPAASLDAGSRLWTWSFCGHAVYRGDPLDSAVPEIPGSNGGHGVVTTATTTVTNTGRRQVKNVDVTLGLTSDFHTEPGCSKPLVHPQSEYPFTWSTS